MNENWCIKTATSIAESFDLTTEVKFKHDLIDQGIYSIDENTIYLNDNIINTVTEIGFFKIVLHEINHAMYCRDMGADAFKSDYELEMERCIVADLEPYFDNYYERKAEEFAEEHYYNCHNIWGNQ